MKSLKSKEQYLVGFLITLLICTVSLKQGMDRIQTKKVGVYKTAKILTNPKGRKGMFSLKVKVNNNEMFIDISKEKANEIIYSNADTIGVLYNEKLVNAVWAEHDSFKIPYIQILLFCIPLYFLFGFFRNWNKT